MPSVDGIIENIILLSRCFRSRAQTEEVMGTLSRTMTGGRDGYGNPERNKLAYTGDFADFLVKWAECKDVAASSFPIDIEAFSLYYNYRSFMEVARLVCGRQRIFITSHGHIGLGPENMAKADTICIFGGATMPHILRKVDEYFVLVGDCFVDNLMDGEAVIAMRKGEVHTGPILTESFLEKTGGDSQNYSQAQPPIQMGRPLQLSRIALR
ncbi:hypothetical protein B0O99DRAFT_691542 [Bisporella sp. PMI_857]|nr:hypothetical protein B0O99DRAFT_691542 [Bisporella sp. PMI_857]